MSFILGRQELLVLLVDASSSMYVGEDANGQTVGVNKHSQVQNTINALITQINATNKQDNILIAIVVFAENATILKADSSEFSYNPSRIWLANDNIQNRWASVNNFKGSLRTLIGKNTSFISAFTQAKVIIDEFINDDRIGPENRHGISIMFFSDGNDNSNNEQLLQSIGEIIGNIKNTIRTNILERANQENFSISSIAIGKDADETTMKVISTPYTQIQDAQISTLRSRDIKASMCVDEHRCYLKLNANNDTIVESELKVLRKFLFLVTGTPLL
jgi:hypothetical protein